MSNMSKSETRFFKDSTQGVENIIGYATANSLVRFTDLGDNTTDEHFCFNI